MVNALSPPVPSAAIDFQEPRPVPPQQGGRLRLTQMGKDGDPEIQERDSSRHYLAIEI